MKNNYFMNNNINIFIQKGGCIPGWPSEKLKKYNLNYNIPLNILVTINKFVCRMNNNEDDDKEEIYLSTGIIDGDWKSSKVR